MSQNIININTNFDYMIKNDIFYYTFIHMKK